MIVTTRRAAYVGLLISVAWLQGCSDNASTSTAPQLPVYAADVAGGAKMCEAKAPSLVPNQAVDAGMKVVNDGGWCGISVHQEGSKPFDSELLTARPAHGTVTVHPVGSNTRIDYVPDRGFTGTDSFAVKLLPGSSVVQVAVSVTAK